MINIFSQILRWLPIEAATSTSSNHFGGMTPFNIQVNFDIPIFEGQLDADSLEKWVNLLEGYLQSIIFVIKKRSLSPSLRLFPMSKIGGRLTMSKHP